MDPVTLATITAAATTLATECIKGAASEAGKTAWNAIKSLFGWNNNPELSDLAKNIATEIEKKPTLARQIVELLQNDASSGNASALVDKIDAEKVVVAEKIEVEGNFNM